MSLHSWRAIKKIFSGRIDVLLTIAVFAYILAKVGSILLPIFPPEAMFILNAILLAVGVRNDGFLHNIAKDLESIPSAAHYTFFLIATSLYVLWKWTALVRYCRIIKQKINNIFLRTQKYVS
jgi:hypothetical protein